MDFKEAVGAIIAAIVLLVPAVKWLINDWSKKAEEIEKLKKANTQLALNRLDEEVKNFRSAIDNIREQLRNLSSGMLSHKADIASLKEKLAETNKILDMHSQGFNEKIRNQIKTEVTNLTHQLIMIRNKKNGIG